MSIQIKHIGSSWGRLGLSWGHFRSLKELLGPLGIGLVGLMLACLLAAMMSSVDCYMLVCAALVVRNIYVPFIKPDAGEKECLTLGRITGAIVVIGAVVGALVIDDMFAILKQTWIVPMTFAALFWVGMYWRRATTTAGWVTVIFCVMSFFVLPRIIPAISPDLRSNETFLKVTEVVETKTERKASPSDVAAGKSEVVGETITEVKRTGGKSLYWSNGVKTDVGVARGEGTFRFDLFHRLAVVHAVIPPLRDRIGDLPALIRAFYSDRGVDPGPIEGPNLDRLRTYRPASLWLCRVPAPPPTCLGATPRALLPPF